MAAPINEAFMDNRKPERTLAELQVDLQKYVDENFICPTCKTHNNFMVVDMIINCNCVPECQVKIARVAGKCNDCEQEFAGLIGAQKGAEIVHGIEKRIERHGRN
jgi:hypothetical protein